MNFKFNAEHTFFTSDTHFNHANIIGFCNRPFKDVRYSTWVIFAWVVLPNGQRYWIG